MSKNRFSRESSLLVTWGSVGLWAAGVILSAVFQRPRMTGLFLFLLLLALLSRTWAHYAMRKVSIDLDCDTAGLFPGESLQMDYVVRNRKALPLPWMEISMNAAERDCVLPGEDLERYCYHGKDGAEIPAYRLSFPFLRGNEELKIRTRWQAQRRGIFRVRELLIRSGDGFGLTQSETLLPREEITSIAVYPKQVPVDISGLLRYTWENATGARGFTEDRTILRGTRPYQTGDPWKQINWRMAARDPEHLSVNLYETVRPSGFLFVLDGESFCGLSEDDTELEETLSLLGSLITALSEQRITCGLCLPESEDMESVCLAPAEERTAEELLTCLAGYRIRNRDVVLPNGTHTEEKEKSLFDTAALHAASAGASAVYFLTWSPERMPDGLIYASETGRSVLLTGAPQLPENHGYPDVRTVPMREYRRADG